MYWKLLRINFVFVLFFVIAAGAAGAGAAEKKVLVAFDKSYVCCLVNEHQLTEMLVEVKGITKADYVDRQRAIYIDYDDSKIDVPTIVDTVVKITDVERDIIIVKEL